MKKVLIFYASYGGGHLSAARSIEECIKTNYPNVETDLVDCMKYINGALEKITTTAYKEMAKKFPWAWGKVYSDSQKGPLAHISSYSNKIMAVKLLKLLRQEQPDLVISTHPFGSQMCSYLRRKGKIDCKIATVMTDYAPHDQWLVGADYVDAIFVAHDQMKKQIEEEGIDASKIFSTGIPVSSRFLESFDKKALQKEFSLKEDKKTILFFGGGEFGLGKTKTLEVFKELLKNFPDFQVVAISGKNEKMKHAFEEVVAENKKEDLVHVISYSKQIPELMYISDFVVTKPGGLTVTESLVSGLPLFIINPIPGQEEENASFLEEKQVAVWLKKGDNIKEKLSILLDDPKKTELMKENVKKLARPNSTKDICKISLDTIL